MNKNLRILTAIIFTTIYCFAIVVVNAAPLVSNEVGAKNRSEEKVYTAIASDLSSHASFSESFDSNITPDREFKKIFVEFCSCASSVQLNIIFEGIQCAVFSQNFLLAYRKTDIIFPFHYFW